MDKEEERKRRLEEARNIIANTTGLNSNSNDIYSQRLQEANSIINSVNSNNTNSLNYETPSISGNNAFKIDELKGHLGSINEQREKENQKIQEERNPIVVSVPDTTKENKENKETANSKTSNNTISRSVQSTVTEQTENFRNQNQTGLFKANSDSKISTQEEQKNTKKLSDTDVVALSNGEVDYRSNSQKVIDSITGVIGNILEGAEDVIPSTVEYSNALVNYLVGKNIDNGLKFLGYSEEDANKIKQTAMNNLNNSSTLSQLNALLNSEEQVQKRNENIQRNTAIASSNPLSKKLAEIAPSVGQNLVPMAVSAINPVAGSLLFIGSAGGSYYEDGKNRGMTEEQAVGYSTVMGILEGGTEYIITGNMVDKIGRKLFGKGLTEEALKSYGVSTAENFFQEAIMEPLQEANAQLFGGKDAANWDNIWQRSLEAGIDGIISATILGGASVGIASAENVVNKANPTSEEYNKAFVDTVNSGKVDVKGIIEGGQEAIILNQNMERFYTTTYNQEGNVESVEAVQGKAIDNPNKKVNVSPVIVKNKQNEYYNVIDSNTGLLLDTTPYQSLIEAQARFSSKMINLDNAAINNVNNRIAKANIAINQAMNEVVSRAESEMNADRTMQNAQKNVINDTQTPLKNVIETPESSLNNVNANTNAYQRPQNDISDDLNNETLNYINYMSNNVNIARNQNNGLNEVTRLVTQIQDNSVYNREQTNEIFQAVTRNIPSIEIQVTDNATYLNSLDRDGNISYQQQIANRPYMGSEIRDTINSAINNADLSNINVTQASQNGFTGVSNSNTINNISQNKNAVVGQNNNLKRGGIENAKRKQSRTNADNGQEINRKQKTDDRERARANEQSNDSIKEELSVSLRNYEKEKSSSTGKTIKAKLVDRQNYSKNEQIISSGFNETTGLEVNVYSTDIGTSEGAFYDGNNIFLKHNAMASKRVTNFKPYHELGHWLRNNYRSEWNKLYNIMNETITDEQINQYRNVLNNKAVFDNMSQEEIRDYTINEIISDYIGNWSNNIVNWEQYIVDGSISQEYADFLADISLENEVTGYNVFGSIEQQEQMYNEISGIMYNIIGNRETNNNRRNTENVIKYTDRADVVFDKDGKFSRVRINEDIFANNTNNQSISKIIHDYLVQHIGEYYYILESGQKVYLGKDLPGEYAYSKSSQSLLTTQKLAKGRAASGLKQIIENATNRQYKANYKSKHRTDAKYGFYRYDTRFSFIQNGKENIYKGTVLVRNDADGKKYLYDILDIKKVGSNLPPVASNSKKSSAIFGGSNSLPSNNSIAPNSKNVNTPISATNTNNTQNNKNNTSKTQNIDRNLDDNAQVQTEYDKKVQQENRRVARQVKESTRTKPGVDNGIRAERTSTTTEYDNQGNRLTRAQRDFFKDSKVRDENGKLKVVYHGTQRADRVGNYFDPNKATSGPMAFFTDNREIAANYSTQKQDTSLSREYDTEFDLFKVNGMDLDTYWNSLESDQKQEIINRSNNIGFDEDFENIIYEANASRNSFGDQFEWRLKNEYNGNALRALYSIWIEDGNLMQEDMSKFKTVLEYAGLSNIEYVDLYKTDSNVYEVYLNIKNPFDTSNISKNIIKQLENASKTAKTGEMYSADLWDKSNISPKAWIEKLHNDLENNSTHAWTVIPDWVTNVLKTNGYDGIIDTGGKGGGVEHQVVIPFYSNQIKNITNKKPTTSNPDIRYESTNNSTSQPYDARRYEKNADFVNYLKENNYLKTLMEVDEKQGETYAHSADRLIEQEIRKLEETNGFDNSIPVTKLTDIDREIENYLGKTIGKGHFRERARGIYNQKTDNISVKEYKDLDNVFHELGHALDLGGRIKVDKSSLSNELLAAVKRHGGYENETIGVQLDEGFAEILKTYVINEDIVRADYPKSYRVLEDFKANDVNFGKFITKIQQDTYNYIHQNPQNRILSNVSIGEQTDKAPITANTVKENVVKVVWDSNYSIKEMVNQFAKVNGNKLSPSQNAYLLTRLASGVDNKAISMISNGYVDLNGNRLMPGLNKLGEILGNNQQRWNDLRTYLVAKRDLEYKAKSLRTGIRTMDSKAVVEQFYNDSQIQEAAQVVYDTLDGVLQYAVNNKLITEETAKSLRESNAFYVPFQRVIEGKGNTVGRRGAVADIINKRTGSELDIKDVLENIVANSTNIIQQVENNNILQALAEQGEEAGISNNIFKEIPPPMKNIGKAQLSTWEAELKNQGVDTSNLDLEKTIDLFVPNNNIITEKDGSHIVSFFDKNGKRKYLQFYKSSTDIFNALMGLDKNANSVFLRLMRAANMPLRYGATMANVGFAIPNMISDTVQATIYSEAGFIPVVDNVIGILDILGATNKTVRNFLNQVAPEYAGRINRIYDIYQQTGASSSTRMSQYRKSTQEIMRDIYGTKNSEVLGIKDSFKPLKRLMDILTYIPELSESSTRFRVFERNYEAAKNKGSSELDARIQAAIESRDATQDFGRTGTVMKEVNQLIPFSAARVGSAYTFAEKVKANPKRTAARVAILLTVALAIKAIGYDDDEIEELNQRKKDDNFVFKVGNTVVTIKKPQGILRSIINLGEYILDLSTGHIEEGKEGERLVEWTTNAIMDNMPADSVTGLVPNPIAPIVENAINRDFYYNTDIVKSYDLDLPDEQQYYDYTSQLAIWLGKIFNYSPAKIDNLISGYFGGLGTQTTNTIDWISGKMGLSAEEPAMGAEDNAIGKRFVVNVNENSASVDEIYKREEELTKKQNGGTITDEEEKELEEIKAGISKLSALNKQIKAIKQDLTMSGEEKAEQIRPLQEQKVDVARQALGKDPIYTENTDELNSLEFYPSRSTLSYNGYTLELTEDMKQEYEDISYELYKKYEKQGLYSEEYLDKLKSKCKEAAKKQIMQKYRNQLTKSK